MIDMNIRDIIFLRYNYYDFKMYDWICDSKRRKTSGKGEISLNGNTPLDGMVEDTNLLSKPGNSEDSDLLSESKNLCEESEAQWEQTGDTSSHKEEHYQIFSNPSK